MRYFTINAWPTVFDKGCHCYYQWYQHHRYFPSISYSWSTFTHPSFTFIGLLWDLLFRNYDLQLHKNWEPQTLGREGISRLVTKKWKTGGYDGAHSSLETPSGPSSRASTPVPGSQHIKVSQGVGATCPYHHLDTCWLFLGVLRSSPTRALNCILISSQGTEMLIIFSGT